MFQILETIYKTHTTPNLKLGKTQRNNLWTILRSKPHADCLSSVTLHVNFTNAGTKHIQQLAELEKI